MNETEKILMKEIEEHKSPSVQYLLFDQKNILKKYQFGYADLLNRKPVNDDTSYNAYSVTKTFTALAVLQLAAQNLVDINQPVINYLPDFVYSPQITIKQLLNHSSGLPNPIPLNWIHLADEHLSFKRDAFFSQVIAKNKKVKSLPNEKFAYSNLGYIILGNLIEKVSGKTYENYITDNILNKLGLTPCELGFEIADLKNQAKGYQKRYSILNLMLGFFINKSKFIGSSEGKWNPFNFFYVNGIVYGGLIGKPKAFVKYLQDLLRTDSLLISEEFKKLMFIENYTNNNKPTGMCISWFTGMLKGNKYYTHAGGGGGYYVELRIYPEQGIGSVIFFNRTGIKDERFLDKVDKIYFENCNK